MKDQPGELFHTVSLTSDKIALSGSTQLTLAIEGSAPLRVELPKDVAAETGVTLDLEAKKKILGLNAAKLYGVDVAAQKDKLGYKKKVLAGGGWFR